MVTSTAGAAAVVAACTYPAAMIDGQTTTSKKRGSFWRELPVLAGVAILVAVLVRFFALESFYIPSGSMEHTLELNDQVLVNKLVYDFRDPRRGEIIVFKAPSDWQTGTEGQDFIKRIIALGGDRVVCCDAKDRITVNGKAIDEPYIYRDSDGTQDRPGQSPFDVTVPAGRLWVMGDHRSASGDSLMHWSVTRDPIESTIAADTVIGRAFVRFWPLSRIDLLSAPDY
jgi:signal peptidase I